MIIADRRSCIDDADRVVLLAAGRIVEGGAPTRLAAGGER